MGQEGAVRSEREFRWRLDFELRAIGKETRREDEPGTCRRRGCEGTPRGSCTAGQSNAPAGQGGGRGLMGWWAWSDEAGSTEKRPPHCKDHP